MSGFRNWNFRRELTQAIQTFWFHLRIIGYEHKWNRTWSNDNSITCSIIQRKDLRRINFRSRVNIHN